MKSNGLPQVSAGTVSLSGLLNPDPGFPGAPLSKPDHLSKVLKNQKGKKMEDIICFQIYVFNDTLL